MTNPPPHFLHREKRVLSFLGKTLSLFRTASPLTIVGAVLVLENSQIFSLRLVDILRRDLSNFFLNQAKARGSFVTSEKILYFFFRVFYNLSDSSTSTITCDIFSSIDR